MNNINSFFLIILLGFISPIITANTDTPEIQAIDASDHSETWNDQLKEFYFPEINIIESNALFDFKAPYRAEDGAMVPIDITAKIPQSLQRYIKTYSVIIDKNPKPLAGTFKFSPVNGKADLSMRIRVDAYSPVRVVAETSDGQYYMVSHYVKSSGGCSAPASTDAATALARLGKIRLKTPVVNLFDKPVQTRLAISHPNTSGLQKDQVTTLFIPPHYISNIDVKFDDELIFSAKTDISISENPNFKFYFVPDKAGVLTTVVTDTEGNEFTQTEKLKAAVE